MKTPTTKIIPVTKNKKRPWKHIDVDEVIVGIGDGAKRHKLISFEQAIEKVIKSIKSIHIVSKPMLPIKEELEKAKKFDKDFETHKQFVIMGLRSHFKTPIKK